MISATTIGIVLVLNTTMTLANLAVLLVNGSHIIKEFKR
jgi:hypothetical protein